DAAISSWLQTISQALEPQKGIRRRIVPRDHNQVSTALWLNVEDVKILLSADLEESGSQTGGWRVVVESNERPTGKASVNKIPHHGSENGHCDAVWSEMLDQNPLSILAPYNSGRKKLPAPLDIQRIKNLTNRAYITSDLKDRTFRGKTGSVNR